MVPLSKQEYQDELANTSENIDKVHMVPLSKQYQDELANTAGAFFKLGGGKQGW